MYVCIYIYAYTHIHTHIHNYIHIHITSSRPVDPQPARKTVGSPTVFLSRTRVT